MELQEALFQISAIRRQMARTEQFRGYRAAPVAVSAGLACLAGAMQSQWIPEPATHLREYLALWIAVAAVSFAICLASVWVRNRRSTGLLQHETTQLAIEQFFPCLVAGGLLTLVIARVAPQAGWMLPGLWAILFSMGLFASWRLMPPAILGVAIYYLAGGLGALAWMSNHAPLSPCEMPLLFGGGQSITAIALLLSQRKGTQT